MSTRIPPVSTYMTPLPITIGKTESVVAAEKTMHEHAIRHLPVIRGDKIIGLLSLRDIEIVRGLRGVDAEAFQSMTVDDVMTDTPYVVDADTPLDEVTGYMAKARLGSAVIMEKAKLAGIFTTVDALQAIHDLLQHEKK